MLCHKPPWDVHKEMFCLLTRHAMQKAKLICEYLEKIWWETGQNAGEGIHADVKFKIILAAKL